MKKKNLHKIIVITMAIICIMVGTMSYAANKTENKSSNSTNTTENKKKDEGLSKIEIDELELSPKFETKTYEYTVKYIGESESLTIDAEPTEAYYDVKIIGNSKLKEGENLITILVTDADEKNIATYQITVNKSLIDEEAENKKQEKAKRQEYMVKIAGGILAGIIILFIIILIIKNRRKSLEEWENWASNENDEDEEYKKEELPKALRNSKKDNNSKGKRYK